jgi:hypothetical protein
VDSVGLYGAAVRFLGPSQPNRKGTEGQENMEGNYHHQDTENTEFQKLNVSENGPFFDPDAVPPNSVFSVSRTPPAQATNAAN